MKKKFILIIILILVVLVPIVLYMSLNSHKLISEHDFDDVEEILIDGTAPEYENYDDEEFFNLLKNTWTRVPLIHTCNCERVEFTQYYITVVYTDGTDDDIYVLKNPYNSNSLGYVTHALEKGHIVPTAKSYCGYADIVEYIENVFK